MMNGWEKSDSFIVATKLANKPVKTGAESMERRRETERNRGATLHAPDTERTNCMNLGLLRVRQAARERKKESFTALLHHVDVDLLRRAYGWLKKTAAAGVDGMTWKGYERDLESRLTDLHGRIHRNAYRALPSRRQYIPKADGQQRPLGIAALEDKIVQRALVEVLNAIYEEDFLGFSYGFRPKRGQHDALDALAVGITQKPVNWIMDADIRKFFDTISHEWLIRFLKHRIGDPRVIRLIKKWLKAGYMEEGELKPTEKGSPQGAVISPLLANIYLHYVFDLWANQWRRRNAQGEMIVVRYADDIVVGFENRMDAERFREELEERLGQFSLALHPEKTRLIEFGRFAAVDRARRGMGKPETFNFLGFTHICGRSRKGGFLLMRHSRRDRMQAKLQEIKEELRRRMHQSIPEVGRWLSQVIRGYFAYHAVPTNSNKLSAFRDHVVDLWHKMLRRRSQKDKTNWARMASIVNDWLPRPRILHPWPGDRFAAKHSR